MILAFKHRIFVENTFYFTNFVYSELQMNLTVSEFRKILYFSENNYSPLLKGIKKGKDVQ